jgi:hypothetical protein
VVAHVGAVRLQPVDVLDLGAVDGLTLKELPAVENRVAPAQKS